MNRIILLIGFLMYQAQSLAQCAMCKAVAEDAAAEEGSNINKAIMYIMIIPYIILIIAFRKKVWGLLKSVRDIPEANKRT